MHFTGQLFRVLDVVWQHEPLSGEGAKRVGGRFNQLGIPALYTALSADTAYQEASQGAGINQPVTTVVYNADIEDILDLSTPELAKAARITWSILADDTWRAAMKARGIAPSQVIANRLIGDGFAGMLVKSFAPGVKEDAKNLVLWKWGDALPYRLTLIDDENRLARTTPRKPTTR